MKKKLIKILKYCLLFSYVFFGCIGIYQIYSIQNIDNTNIQLKKIYTNENSQDTKLKSINKDYVGWLTIENTNVDGAVVQTDNNDSYLRQDFYGNYSIGGTFYVDKDVNIETDNIIIYGHMMRDNQMFGELKNYKDLEYFKNHRTIIFNDKYYERFSCIITPASPSSENFIDIRQYILPSESKEMLDDLKDNSYIWADNSFFNIKDNKYLFLVTCENINSPNRMILACREVGL